MHNTFTKTLKTAACFAVMGVALAACGGKHSPRAAQVTTADKKMSCEELKLEINDAMYIRQTAMENRGLSARNILWPFGYPATYMSAEEALDSAERRIAYLQSIFATKGCDRPL